MACLNMVSDAKCLGAGVMSMLRAFCSCLLWKGIEMSVVVSLDDVERRGIIFLV